MLRKTPQTLNFLLLEFLKARVESDTKSGLPKYGALTVAAIVDLMVVGIEELVAITKQYPDAVVRPIHPTTGVVRRFRVIIPDEDEDSWYQFLVANRIAMSSKNFCSRTKSDPRFAARMKATLASSVSIDTDGLGGDSDSGD
jgi:hypothetical protein